MSFKYIRDSLPWLVPSAAIVFAGAGFLERNSANNTAPAQSSASDYAAAAAWQQQAEVAPAAVQPAPVAAQDEVVARLDTGNDQLDRVLYASVRSGPEVQAPQVAASPEPEPEPEPAPERQAALSAPASVVDTSFFSGAKVDEARAQCVEDLRNLASQARVYFPSGGLTAEESGIEAGRLLGLVAQSCRDVQILVEGHSDPSGDPAANLRLSEQRAAQVITRIAAAGIDTSMFVPRGMGDAVPSNVTGPEPSWFYDRRVEFSVIDPGRNGTVAAVRVSRAANPWAGAQCVQEMQRAVAATMIFYPNRSVSLRADEFETALDLANMAMECPHARLRVIGHHSGDVQAGETIGTGILRAKALMSMLVGRGIDAGEVIIAAPSRPGGVDGQPGSRVAFDIILEDG